MVGYHITAGHQLTLNSALKQLAGSDNLRSFHEIPVESVHHSQLLTRLAEITRKLSYQPTHLDELSGR